MLESEKGLGQPGQSGEVHGGQRIRGRIRALRSVALRRSAPNLPRIRCPPDCHVCPRPFLDISYSGVISGVTRVLCRPTGASGQRHATRNPGQSRARRGVSVRNSPLLCSIMLYER